MTPVHTSRSHQSAYALVPWLSYLWSRVLFPGQPHTERRASLTALLLLLILPGLLLYPCLSFHLFEPDEGRYAEIPREMLERGDWIVPYLQGEPYLEKPPLFYWLVMLSFGCFGAFDWAARLVPALALHATILTTYGLGRRSLGERAAFWGALALGLAPGFLGMGRLLLLDGVLTLCMTVSLLAAFEAIRGAVFRWSWWSVAAVACGLGILTKGPIALVLLVPPLVLQRYLHKTGCAITWKRWAAFLMMAALVVLPWYVAISLRMPDFVSEFLIKHNLQRFLDPFDHERPIWFYGPVLLGGLLPATLLLIPFVRFLLSGDEAIAKLRCPELGYFLLAGGWCVFFFSLSGCKLPTYIMPAFPPLALALGHYVSVSRWRQSRWTIATGGAAFGLLACAHYVVVPYYAEFRSPMGRADEVATYCKDKPVICYPRHCDSVAFYLGRDDFRSYRSKETPTLIQDLLDQPRTVILFTHRHSLEGLRLVLPPQLKLVKETPLSGSWRDWMKPEYCYMAIVKRIDH
ncbi:MAG: ArnT family glycosyltransferase [Gemmataceae bacterium]